MKERQCGGPPRGTGIDGRRRQTQARRRARTTVKPVLTQLCTLKRGPLALVISHLQQESDETVQNPIPDDQAATRCP